MRYGLKVAALLLAAGCAGPAAAHVGIAVNEAPVGASYRATLVVGHGCDGAATTAIRVQVLEGFFNVRPMPKSGWTLEIVAGKYSRPFETGHGTVTEGVTEISWSGGELPDSQFDEFVFRGTFGGELEAGTRFYFPVIQVCGDVEDAWIDTSGDEDAELPAPHVELLPATGHGH
jgi:uncharacterized protein YcnI